MQIFTKSSFLTIGKIIAVFFSIFAIAIIFYPQFNKNWKWVYRRINWYGPSVTTDIARMDNRVGNTNVFCEFLKSNIFREPDPSFTLHIPDKSNTTSVYMKNFWVRGVKTCLFPAKVKIFEKSKGILFNEDLIKLNKVNFIKRIYKNNRNNRLLERYNIDINSLNSNHVNWELYFFEKKEKVDLFIFPKGYLKNT